MLWFLSSLIPLAACVIFMYCDLVHIWLPAVVVLCIGLFFLFTKMVLLLRKKKKQTIEKCKVLRNIRLNRHIPVDILFAYILPLIAFDLRNGKQAICFLVILFVYCILYVCNRTYHVNVLLYLVGYKSYLCQDENGKEIMVIAKKGWNSFTESNASCECLGGEDCWIVIKHWASAK